MMAGKSYYILKVLSSYLRQFGAIIIVFFLTPESYGELAIVISLAQLLFIFSCGITNGAQLNIGTRVFRETGQYTDILVYRYAIIFFHLILIALIMYLFLDEINKFFEVDDVVFMVVALYGGYLFYETATQLLYPSNLFEKQVVTELLLNVMLLIGVVFFVSTMKNYVLLFLIISLFVTLYVLYTFFRRLYSKPILSFVRFKEVYQYSSWQVISVFSIYILNSTIPYIFAYFNFSNEDLGYYQFGFRLFLGMSGFFALALVVIPKVMNYYPELRSRIHGLCLASVLTLSIVYLFAYFFIGFLLNFFERQEYSKSIDVMIYMFPSFIFMCYSNIMNTVFSNTELYRKAQLVILIQALLFVSSSFLFVEYFGMVGIVMSYAFSYSIGAVYTAYIYFINRALISG